MRDKGHLPSTDDTLTRLFRYKAWANERLLQDLIRLDDLSPVLNLAIKALSHSYVVDRIFAANLRRKRPSYMSANLTELPTLTTLAADVKASDREYIDYVASLQPDQLAERIDFMFTDGKPGCMSREEMLVHVITHGVGHRGQISAVMLLHSMTPTVDGFTTYLHTTEASARGRVAT